MISYGHFLSFYSIRTKKNLRLFFLFLAMVLQARPLFKDRRNFPRMVDPLLQGRYPSRGLYQALAVAAMCLREQAATRPLIGDVVTALTYLASQTYDPNTAAAQNNRIGPSFPRHRDEQKSLGAVPDTQDEVRHGGRHGDESPRNSPDLRQRNHVRGVSFGAEVGRGESGGGSGRKWGLDELERQESQRDSPIHARKTRQSSRNINRDSDRERAVAEAKVWGDIWRERKRANTCGHSDGTNE